MTSPRNGILITGATGLVGGKVLRRLLRRERDVELFVLVRDAQRWSALASQWSIPRARVTPILGDLTAPGLGLRSSARRAIETNVRTVLHAAADTVFSRPVDEARKVNTAGTANAVRVAEACGVTRFVHVSTAFVAGRRTGQVRERDNGPGLGFVNGYEQSKYEGELVVRGSKLPWVIVRPSAIVCDDRSGHVSQYNAVHRGLRLYHVGLASMMPGLETNPVDLVPADYVADCTLTFLRAPGIAGRTFHVCAGAGAIPLGLMLDLACDAWSRSPAWKRRAIPRPALADLDTYRLFERAVEETGDERLRSITRSLSHFVPQLALPKHFETAGTEAVTGRGTPVVAEFWPNLMRYLMNSDWASDARRAA